ncbi:MAG: selenophosphate synthase [Akkermansiaceae bacterium]
MPEEIQILLADAQTSGGLLLAVNPKDLHQAQDILYANGAHIVSEIGILSSPDVRAIVVS